MENNDLKNVLFKRAAGELMLKKCGKTDNIREHYSEKFFHDKFLINDSNLKEDFRQYAEDTLPIYMEYYIKSYIEDQIKTDASIKNYRFYEKELIDFLGEKGYRNLKY